MHRGVLARRFLVFQLALRLRAAVHFFVGPRRIHAESCMWTARCHWFVARTAASDLARIKWRGSHADFQNLSGRSRGRRINLGSEQGQRALDLLLEDVDLLILEVLSTLCTSGGESASDAWVPMQNWLLMLRRRGIAVLFIHHAGTNGRQRGTSRREDALDTVIALRRPEDYSPEQGARFEIHFEKLRNRVDSAGAVPFEASLESFTADGRDGIRWCSRDLVAPILKRAAALFADGLTVREVAAILRVSKSEAGRLRIQALDDGLLTPDEDCQLKNHRAMVQ